MVLMTHNTDIADAWEREGEDPRFFYLFSPDGYAVGIKCRALHLESLGRGCQAVNRESARGRPKLTIDCLTPVSRAAAVHRQRAALVVLSILLFTTITTTGQSERFRSSVPRGTSMSGTGRSPGDTGIAPEASWSIRKERLNGGRQDGVDLVTIDNGRLTVTLVPTRGMGILRVVMGDMRLGWGLARPRGRTPKGRGT